MSAAGGGGAAAWVLMTAPHWVLVRTCALLAFDDDDKIVSPWPARVDNNELISVTVTRSPCLEWMLLAARSLAVWNLLSARLFHITVDVRFHQTTARNFYSTNCNELPARTAPAATPTPTPAPAPAPAPPPPASAAARGPPPGRRAPVREAGRHAQRHERPRELQRPSGSPRRDRRCDRSRRAAGWHLHLPQGGTTRIGSDDFSSAARARGKPCVANGAARAGNAYAYALGSGLPDSEAAMRLMHMRITRRTHVAVRGRAVERRRHPPHLRTQEMHMSNGIPYGKCICACIRSRDTIAHYA